jgi:hypothetical protein
MYYDYTRPNVQYSCAYEPSPSVRIAHSHALDSLQRELISLEKSGVVVCVEHGMDYAMGYFRTTLTFSSANDEEVYVYLKGLYFSHDYQIGGLSCSPLYNHNLRRIYDFYEAALLRQRVWRFAS